MLVFPGLNICLGTDVWHNDPDIIGNAHIAYGSVCVGELHSRPQLPTTVYPGTKQVISRLLGSLTPTQMIWIESPALSFWPHTQLQPLQAFEEYISGWKISVSLPLSLSLPFK